MNHFQITITGNYWDSFIYMKYLVLYTFDNTLYVCNWDKIETDFYDNMVFNQNDFIIEEKDLDQYTIRKIDLEFESLSTDICIANKKLYVTNDDGFFSCDHLLAQHTTIQFDKIWDNKSYSINTSKGNIALSCGSDGLFEYSRNKSHLPLERIENNLYLISANHSTQTKYNDYDLFNMSEIEESELFHFEYGSHFEIRALKEYKLSRIIASIESDLPQYQNENFGKKISWLHKNKIFRVINSNEIEVISYSNIHGDLTFKSEGVMRFQGWKGDILSGDSTPFGNIVECDNALVVSFSNNDFLNIPGEIVQWRVYPSSRSFLNHLHVIKDDCLEIYMFNRH